MALWGLKQENCESEAKLGHTENYGLAPATYCDINLEKWGWDGFEDRRLGICIDQSKICYNQTIKWWATEEDTQYIVVVLRKMKD